MRAFGNYILSSRIHAIGIVSLLSVLSFYLSSILMALIVLRRGGVFGIQVLSGCVILVILAFPIVLQISFEDILFISLRTWVPVWCCAMVLRKFESQAAAILVAGAFGALFIALMYMLVGDVPVWWQSLFNDLLDSIVAANLPEESLDAIEKLKTDIALIAPLMNPFIVSGMVISLSTTILIGRWWQSLLFNPGAFRKEFYAFQLPRSLLYLTLAGIVIMSFDSELQLSVVRDLLWLMIVMYLFQGISSVHRLVRTRGFSSTWLVMMYSLLLILAKYMILLVACIGMADSWMRSKKVIDKNKDNL